MSETITALFLGCVLDLVLGDPEWFPHPVRGIGRFIGRMEKTLRKGGGNLRGRAVVLTASTLMVTGLSTALALRLLALLGVWPHFLGMALLFWLGLSARNLADEAGRESGAGGFHSGRAQTGGPHRGKGYGQPFQRGNHPGYG